MGYFSFITWDSYFLTILYLQVACALPPPPPPIPDDIWEDFLHLVLFLHFLVNISQQPI